MPFTTACARRSARRRPRLGESAGANALGALLALLSPLWLLALSEQAAALFSVGDCAPCLIPLAVAVVAWTRAPSVAILFAVLLGCGADLAGGTPWGVGGVRLGVLAAAFAGLRQSVATEIPGTGVLLVGLFVLAERLIYAATLTVWIPALAAPFALSQAAAVALLTTLFAPLAFGVASTLAPREVART